MRRQRLLCIACSVAICLSALVAACFFSALCYRSASSGGASTQAAPVDARPRPERAGIRYAKGFTIEYHGACKELRVLSPWRNARVTFTYILVPRGEKIPHIPPGAMVIETPVRRMAAATSGCLPFIPMLHIEETLAGFSGCKRVSTPEIVERIKAGQVAEIGIGNGGMVMLLNMERLYGIQPEIVMVYGTGLPEYDHHPKLLEAGFKPVLFASYMESSPLGRTEWIKFLAAFFNKEAEADRLFDDIASRYEDLASVARTASPKPRVFYGIPHRGLIWVPGGRSYIAGFVADAGADYMWGDDTTAGSMPLNMEAVVDRAKDADFWMDPGASRSLSELGGLDGRFSLFKAYREERVYNNDAKSDPDGGNDYWETGEARPDLVLHDLVSIFHPELLPSHRRIWYRRLPPLTGGEK